MRKQLVTFALISGTSWLVACGTDPVDATSHTSKDGGAGSTETGSGGGGSTGGSAGSATGGGGSGGASTGGGGTGGGGSAGVATGGAGMGGMMPVMDAASLCDGKTKRALPYAISADFRAPTIIGAAATFSLTATPDCNVVFPSAEGGTGDAATAEASADDAAADVMAEASAPDAGAADVSAADATVSDATADRVETGPPAPACYEFRYDPGLCEAGTCWAGAIYQPGATPPPADAAIQNTSGICIEGGATKIDFMARASRNGARIKFGSIREGMGATEFFITVTTQWAMYSVNIPAGEPYNDPATSTTGGVWNGFSVVVEPQDHVGGTIIQVKDMTWKK